MNLTHAVDNEYMFLRLASQFSKMLSHEDDKRITESFFCAFRGDCACLNRGADMPFCEEEMCTYIDTVFTTIPAEVFQAEMSGVVVLDCIEKGEARAR